MGPCHSLQPGLVTLPFELNTSVTHNTANFPKCLLVFVYSVRSIHVFFHLSEFSLNISRKPSLTPGWSGELPCRFPPRLCVPAPPASPSPGARGSRVSRGSRAAHAPLGLHGAGGEALSGVQTSPCKDPRGAGGQSLEARWKVRFRPLRAQGIFMGCWRARRREAGAAAARRAGSAARSGPLRPRRGVGACGKRPEPPT